MLPTSKAPIFMEQEIYMLWKWIYFFFFAFPNGKQLNFLQIKKSSRFFGMLIMKWRGSWKWRSWSLTHSLKRVDATSLYRGDVFARDCIEDSGINGVRNIKYLLHVWKKQKRQGSVWGTIYRSKQQKKPRAGNRSVLSVSSLFFIVRSLSIRSQRKRKLKRKIDQSSLTSARAKYKLPPLSLQVSLFLSLKISLVSLSTVCVMAGTELGFLIFLPLVSKHGGWSGKSCRGQPREWRSKSSIERSGTGPVPSYC